jgi:hypothetical protein
MQSEVHGSAAQNTALSIILLFHVGLKLNHPHRKTNTDYLRRGYLREYLDLIGDNSRIERVEFQIEQVEMKGQLTHRR